MTANPPRSSSPRTAADSKLVRQHHLSDRSIALRILDANLNRCLEGLRVVEEYLRFGREEAYLAGLCKQLRHDIVHWSAAFPSEQLHAARDTDRDVGTAVEAIGEYRRDDIATVVAANCKRVQQALRSLEEYGKILAADAARQIEQVRYRMYQLERAITMLQVSNQRLQNVQLYVLVDGHESLERFVHLVQEIIYGGAEMIQLRDKRLTDAELLERARAARELTRRARVLLIINDRPDLAVTAQADGVHVGQDDLPVADARRIVGTERLVGVSTHNIEQVERAVCDGANYIGCGPTFPSATKNFANFPGIDFLRQVQANFRIPAFAIGGIRIANLDAVQQTGFHRIAVAHEIVAAPNPRLATQQFKQKLKTA